MSNYLIFLKTCDIFEHVNLLYGKGGCMPLVPRVGRGGGYHFLLTLMVTVSDGSTHPVSVLALYYHVHYH